MTTAMITTLIIIAAASLILNGYQWAERHIERKETKNLIAEGALLEAKYSKLNEVYNNEKLHKEWAIGRIKDQQAVIDQLKAGTMPKPRKVYKPRKEGEQ